VASWTSLHCWWFLHLRRFSGIATRASRSSASAAPPALIDGSMTDWLAAATIIDAQALEAERRLARNMA
jgi:hypothetical protein